MTNGIEDQWKLLLCPRCLESKLKKQGEDYFCTWCSYSGDGTLPEMGKQPGANNGPWETDKFPERHVVTIYRCQPQYMAKPEFESMDINITVMPTTSATQKRGRKWRLLGISGSKDSWWPDDLSPQTNGKGYIGKEALKVRRELRQAISDAICLKLEATPDEINGLKTIITADTLAHKQTYDKDRELHVNGFMR